MGKEQVHYVQLLPPQYRPKCTAFQPWFNPISYNLFVGLSQRYTSERELVRNAADLEDKHQPAK
jgi:hypothetical protein